MDTHKHTDPLAPTVPQRICTMILGSVVVSCSALVPAFRRAAPAGGRRSADALMLDPNERWENYKSAIAATKTFEASPTVDTALSLCRVAATNQDAEPEAVCEALLTVEKAHRATAKSDSGALSRETLAALDGAWRLVFTTGTVETQSTLGRKINYFPLRATQTFDTAAEPMAITNGIFIGDLPLLKFFGSFDWLEDRRRLEFDFDAIAVLGIKFDLPKGGAEELGAATGLGAKSNVKRAEQGKKVRREGGVEGMW